ncbi:hypothetical protein CISG_02333 [Coccidioides immitis RMSCC 3703]|uniref:Uncharacterized protein n=2 Tax=Coccidioides immitis TaxID=5501 RepID=A0A0J8U1W6_COCIT|nr:hypothetical protein CIRG_05996 [Coccidioides immitis RMSCC 2394]KMU80482.1 hypothetical protein CISG_02333 [Coccidioides immitis RMSCC 3703]
MGASRLESQTSPGANQRRETGSRSGIIFENAPCKCYITAFPPPPVKGVDRSRSDSTDHWCLTEGPDHHSHQKVTARAVCPIPPKSSEDGANRTRSTIRLRIGPPYIRGRLHLITTPTDLAVIRAREEATATRIPFSQ